MNNKIYKLCLPLFLLWPFGSFLLALRKINSKSSAIVIILFCAVFGYSFVFMETSADSYRMAWVFNNFSHISFSEIYQLYIQGDIPDIYKFVFYGITKTFSNNPKVLFSLFGLVFGVFWYLSLRIFSTELALQRDVFIVILFIAFFACNPINNVNGARFNTATWLFFYSTYCLVIHNQKKWILGLFCTPLLHFSFLFVAPLILFFYVFKNLFNSNSKFSSILYYTFIFTFLSSFVMDTNVIKLDFLSNAIPLQDSITNKISIYNSDEIGELYKNRTSTSFFLTLSKYFGYAMKIYFFTFIIFSKKLIEKIKYQDSKLNKLLVFILFFMSISYILSSIPSGGRFFIIGYIYCILLMLKLYRIYPINKIKKFIVWLLPVFSFQILFGIGYLSYALVSSTLWYGNLFWIIYEGIGFKFSYILTQ